MFPRVHPDRAKEALRLGVLAVLKYPVPAAELRATVLQALEQCEPRPVEVPAPPAASPPGMVHPTRPLIAPPTDRPMEPGEPCRPKPR